MRGYAATVLGGLAGFVGAYLVLGWALGDRMRAAANACDGGQSPCPEADLVPVLMGVLVVGTVALSSLAVAASVAVARTAAARETALAALVLLGLAFAAVFAFPDRWLPHASWMVLVVLFVLGLILAVARWFGVYWHRRREADASRSGGPA